MTLDALQSQLKVTFADPDLLQTALVHRSYLNEHRTFGLPHNERLEFLGDAVLELVVTDYLYRNHENPEGELTSWRSALVRGDMLARIAEQFKLGEALLMSKGEEKSGGRQRHQLLANAFEAIIGAMYLDQGYEAANDFIHRTVLPELPAIIQGKLDRDPKSRLQEVAQDLVGVTPHYSVEEATGPDHAKQFTIGVWVGKQKLAEGHGTSKQSGEQAAAQQALDDDALNKLKS